MVPCRFVSRVASKTPLGDASLKKTQGITLSKFSLKKEGDSSGGLFFAQEGKTNSIVADREHFLGLSRGGRMWAVEPIQLSLHRVKMSISGKSYMGGYIHVSLYPRGCRTCSCGGEIAGLGFLVTVLWGVYWEGYSRCRVISDPRLGRRCAYIIARRNYKLTCYCSRVDY